MGGMETSGVLCVFAAIDAYKPGKAYLKILNQHGPLLT